MVINVIDTRQSYPQQVVVECLRQMGFEKEANESIHLAYEVVNLSPQAARLLGMEETEEKKAYAMSGPIWNRGEGKRFHPDGETEGDREGGSSFGRKCCLFFGIGSHPLLFAEIHPGESDRLRF